MKKLAIRSSFLLTVAVIVLLAYAVAFPGSSNGTVDERARHIALRDDEIQDAIERNQGVYTIGNVTRIDGIGWSGFINASGVFVKVPFVFGQNMFVGENMNVVVSLEQDRVVGHEQYFRDLKPPVWESATVPPGASWYHQLIGYYDGTVKFVPIITFTPEDAKIYPIIVDRDNMARYMNGTPYRALEYTDFMSGRKCLYDGTESIQSGWSANVSIADPRPATEPKLDVPDVGTYYIILKNGGNKNVEVGYEMGVRFHT